MKLRSFLACLLIMFSFGAVQAQKYKTSPKGTRYKMYKDEPGRNAAPGDIIVFNFQLYTGSDSMLFSTFGQGEPVTFQIDKPKFSGDFMDGLCLLSKGDSATLWVNSDSMRKITNVDPYIKPGTWLRYNVKVLGLYTVGEYKAKLKAEAEKQLEKDTLAIRDYLDKNKLKAERTASGLYYIIDKEGSGDNARAGDTVSVHYTGTLLDGTQFDSSRDRGKPISFILGKHQVIAGWDEGISLLNKGAKARLFIPSSMAYGPRAAGKIPPNSVLIFDVELVGIQ